MKFIFKSSLIALLFITFTASALIAQSGQVSDRIVAIVNDRIILKSDVDGEIRDYMNNAEMQGQQVTFSEDLWYNVLQSIVDNYVLLEQAEVDSVIVSDELVDRQMDQRINQLVRQAGSEQALEEAFGQSLIQLRAEFRDQFREQLTVQQMQDRKISNISITRPEVVEFFNRIPEEELPMIPERVGVSQIVIIPPALDDAREQAYQKASAIRDSILNHDKGFEEMAQRYSDDGSAARGGLLPMMPINDLVANYSAAATALEPGEISEVVRTEFGYHVIRLNQRMGDNIETNHILIRIDDTQVDEQFAIDKLEAIKDSVMNHGKDFREMARRHSDDEDSRAFGGRIVNPQTGSRMMAMDQLEPSLYRIVLLLENEGEISEPRSFNPPRSSASRAFRIVRLDRHVDEHIANLDQDYEEIENLALQQKQMRRLSDWIESLRDEVYIEFKIPMPEIEPEIDEQLLGPTDEAQQQQMQQQQQQRQQQ
ncbi:MAG: peptidylprolyl isomerase [Balneolaceae bacterium]|nr:peptidylprolyl isomerase [Balneolaceae bacterium]MCH8547334.1 peptidylprolyl isomerase [Balneolaceae bacterium]